MIIHVDGDAFFASCEIAQNEALRGKPVVVGQERGIATAVSYEAKRLGIGRGMLMHEVRKICPEVIICSSHYTIYKIYSRRMYDIVRRYAPNVEEYSIDECFADVTDKKDYAQIARNIKRDLEKDLGMTFSIGVAPTKTLAKVASKTQKPAGFTIITQDTIQAFLAPLPIGKIWGIGPSTSHSLMRKGVKTALDFYLQSHEWVVENVAKPYEETWYELRGIPVRKVHTETDHGYKSVMKTRTFKPTHDPSLILSYLAKNAENACIRLRRYNLVAGHLYFYLKTQQFTYKNLSFTLSHKTATPKEIITIISEHFKEIYRPDREYRATGVVLRDIIPATAAQHDLFNNSFIKDEEHALFKIIDGLNTKYADIKIFFARSLRARATEPDTRAALERLSIPFWGDAQ